MEMRRVVVVDAVRSAIARARKGAFIHTRIDDLAVTVAKALMARLPQVQPSEVEDVAAGCAFPEDEQGMNVARNVAIMADFPFETAGVTVNRFCASSMEATRLAALNIMAGYCDAAVALGMEHMTHVPMDDPKRLPFINPEMLNRQALWPMPQTAQNLVEEFGISRLDQDEFSFESHKKAKAATEAGRFKDEIIPVEVPVSDPSFQPTAEKRIFERDECVRGDTTIEKLSSLDPLPTVFSMSGQTVTITAGNSCPVSDGAAALMLMEEKKALSKGLRPLAVVKAFAHAGVDPKIMGIGPVPAVRKALKLAGIELRDVDLVEMNEAFAAQALACVKELGLDRGRLNVNGGAIALGHPLGATGVRIITTLCHEMRRRGNRYGIATLCVGGGQGMAVVLEQIT